MAKLIFDVPYSVAGQNQNNPGPTVTRYTVATLPTPGTLRNGTVVLVTDSTATASAGYGVAPTGGGSNLQAVWSTNGVWIGV